MFIIYAVIGGVWGWQCYRNLQDLLPIQVSLSEPDHILSSNIQQYYLSSLLGFLVVEMVANWGGITSPPSDLAS